MCPKLIHVLKSLVYVESFQPNHICTPKWENIFPHNEFNWPLIFSQASIQVNLLVLLHKIAKQFQFTFLHRMLYTNIQLFKFKCIDSPMNTFCHATEETILHIFYECKRTKTFCLNEVCSWLSREVQWKTEYHR